MHTWCNSFMLLKYLNSLTRKSERIFSLNSWNIFYQTSSYISKLCQSYISIFFPPVFLFSFHQDICLLVCSSSHFSFWLYPCFNCQCFLCLFKHSDHCTVIKFVLGVIFWIKENNWSFITAIQMKTKISHLVTYYKPRISFVWSSKTLFLLEIWIFLDFIAQKKCTFFQKKLIWSFLATLQHTIILWQFLLIFLWCFGTNLDCCKTAEVMFYFFWPGRTYCTGP